ncbi:hypothetical protein GF314_13455 [bacterium]|nr:hypothetical protein [bacterium]
MAPATRSLLIQSGAVLLAVGAIICIGIVAMGTDDDRDGNEDTPSTPASGTQGGDARTDAARPSTADFGQTRPARPAPPLEGVVGDEGDGSPSPLGVQPVVPGDANPQVASVVEAARTGQHPERRTALAMPDPFDRASYEKDPQAYLDVCEPGRVFQPAQPGKDVPMISARSDTSVEVAVGESTTLAAMAAPGAPVTFTSFDLGLFSNELTSITVQADDAGIARATFTAVGCVNDVNILAASPYCSGRATFMIFVPPPAPTTPPVE